MTKPKPKDTEVATTAEPQVPAYIAQGDAALGMDDKLRLRQSTPRLYAIQAQTKNKELRQEHGIGSVVITEGDDAFTFLAAQDEAIVCAPIFRWQSWAKVRHKDDPSDEFWVVEETLDPEHPIAVRACMPTFSDRFENYEGEPTNNKGEVLQYRSVENINFLFAILEGEAKGRVVAYSFAKGGWKYGRKFNSYLERRGIAIFGNRIHLVCGEAESKANPGEVWMQIHQEAASPAFVSDVEYVGLEALFREAEAMHKGMGGIKVDSHEQS